MDNYDVVIIGAGPAGLNCAHELKNTSKSVLILERADKIGSNTYDGCLTSDALDYLGLPSDFPIIKYHDMLINVSGTRVCLKSDKSIVSTVNRGSFCSWMYSRLDGFDNIKTRVNAKVVEINDKSKFVVPSNALRSEVDKPFLCKYAFVPVGIKPGLLSIRYSPGAM